MRKEIFRPSIASTDETQGSQTRDPKETINNEDKPSIKAVEVQDLKSYLAGKKSERELKYEGIRDRGENLVFDNRKLQENDLSTKMKTGQDGNRPEFNYNSSRIGSTKTAAEYTKPNQQKMIKSGNARIRTGTVSVKGKEFSDMTAFITRKRRNRDHRGKEKENIDLCRTEQLHPEPERSRMPCGKKVELGNKTESGNNGDVNKIIKNTNSRLSNIKPENELKQQEADVEETRRS